MDFSNSIAMDIRVRNGLIVQAMTETGKTIREIHEATGIGLNTLYGLMNMTTSPQCKSGEWTKPASVLARYFGYSPEDIFPAHTWTPLYANKRTLFGSFTYDRMEMKSKSDALMYDEDMNRGLERTLGVLSENERKVIELRFGLADGRPMTLDEIGMAFGVSRDRARQYEVKALKKIRQYRLKDAYEVKCMVEDMNDGSSFCEAEEIHVQEDDEE